MGLAIGLLAVGAVLLFIGAESAIRGAGAFARAAGIPLFSVGALLFGIDVEGLGAAVVAAAKGQTAIAAGEVFGTIAFLFSAAFGAALLLARQPVASPGADMVLAPAVGLLAAAFAVADAVVERWEGMLLLALYFGYVTYVVREGRLGQAKTAELEREAGEGPRGKATSALTLLLALGVVYLGATLLVDGGVRLLARTALAPGFVGAAVIGSLASLDEVLLEVIPVRRGEGELATGNLFGTLAAFCTGVLGLAAIVRPLELDGAALAALLYASALYALVATTFLARGKAGRVVGAVVLASYAGWLLVASGI